MSAHMLEDLALDAELLLLLEAYLEQLHERLREQTLQHNEKQLASEVWRLVEAALKGHVRWCSGAAHLEERGEDDDEECAGDEHLAVGAALQEALAVEQRAEREGHGAAQAAVRHDELLRQVHLPHAELVQHVRLRVRHCAQHEHENCSTDR